MTQGGGAEDEQGLVRRAQAGDTAAFEILVRRYQDRVYGLALRLLGNADDAMDVCQEALFRAYEALPRFRGGSAFYTWLYRIVVNQALDHLRRRPGREEAAFDDRVAASAEGGTLSSAAADDPGVQIEARELQAALERAIALLPPVQRAAILLREVEGLSYSDIARALGCSMGTVMSRLHYARKRLQESLREYLP